MFYFQRIVHNFDCHQLSHLTQHKIFKKEPDVEKDKDYYDEFQMCLGDEHTEVTLFETMVKKKPLTNTVW
jgi:hypothetical protein